jgi:hypothetical protein
MTPLRRAVSVFSLLGMLAVLPLAARSQSPEPVAITIDGYEMAVVADANGATGEADVGSPAFLRDFLAGHTDSLVTEIGFPAVDAEVQQPHKIVVKFAPEYTRYQKAPGATRETAATPLSFRLTTRGLDGSAVTAIEGFTVKQVRRTIFPHKSPDHGESQTKSPPEPIEIESWRHGGLTISDLVLRISDSEAAPWLAWQAACANGPCQRRTLRLTYVAGGRNVLALDLVGAEPVAVQRRAGRREAYLVVKMETVLVSG